MSALTPDRVGMLRKAIVGDMDARPDLSRPGLLDILEKHLKATRTTYFAKDGQVTDAKVDEDLAIQQRALQMALALRGEFPSTKLDVNVNTPMERLPDLSALPITDLMRLAGFAEEEIHDRLSTFEGEVVREPSS